MTAVPDVPTTMRAARLHALPSDGGPPDVRIDEVPVPRPGPGEVLVRVLACGVCASDLHVITGATPSGPLPLTLGHEAAGDVALVGEGVQGWLPGDRVLVLPGRTCGTCGYCVVGRENLCRASQVLGVDVDGAQAEYVLAQARGLLPVPRSVPVAQAAILVDAVATPYHALKRAGVSEGVTVAVIGLGGLGMHAVQLARLAGAAQVIGVDPDPVARERAMLAGADEVVDPTEGSVGRAVRALTDGGVDRALEFVGAPATVGDATKVLAPGGRAVLVGLHGGALQALPQHLFVMQELELVGSAGSTAQDVNELVDLLDAGRLDLSASVTHTTDLDGFTGALERLASRDGSPVRIVVEL